MIYVVAGLVLGIIAGLNLNIVYNPKFAVYISLAILAILNALFNIIYENKTKSLTIIKSAAFLLTDLSFALFIGYVGEKLGLPIYLIAIFAFGNNIYKKFKEIVDIYIEKFDKNE